MSGHVWRWTPAKLEEALRFLPDYEPFRAAAFYPAAAHVGERYSSGPGLCRALLAAGRITYTRIRTQSRIRTYRKVFRMKYRVMYSDGETVDVHADTEDGARTHGEHLEQQKKEQGAAAQPAIKYSPRKVQRVELLDDEPAGAKGKAKK